MSDPRAPYWRVGRKVGRTIYRMVGINPSDRDQLIGMMDTPELAREAVQCQNFVADRQNGGEHDGD